MRTLANFMFTKPTILLVSALLLVSSCSADQLIFHNHNLRDLPNLTARGGGSSVNPDYPGDTPTDPPQDTTETPDPPQHEPFYLLTLEYPQGYNWIDDLERGQIDETYFVVYQDFEEISRIKVSDREQVPSDVDRAFLDHGDLYTAFADKTSTILKLNGEELFTIPARENITSLLVEGDDVYTLGSSPVKRDVSYRKNGQSLLYVGDATVIKELYRDGGNVCFSYVVHSPTKKYYYCIGEMAFQLQGVDGDWTIYDLQTLYSQPMYVYRDEGYIVYFVHPQRTDWLFSVAPDENYFYDYELVRLQSDVVPVEHYHYGNREDVTVFAEATLFVEGVTYSQAASYACGDRVVVVAGKRGEGYVVEEISGRVRQQTRMPARFTYAPPKRAVTTIDGQVYAGFSTKSVDGESIIQMGRNEYKGFRFNGYIVALGK